MKYSILMPNYNKSMYIAQAIESILTQTYSDWELLIIDDASNDTSREIIRNYLSDKRIKFFHNKSNMGKTASLIKLMSFSVGDILVEFDSDDFLEKNTLERINKIYVKNSDVGFVYTQCYYCDKDLKPIHLGYSSLIPSQKSNLNINSIVALRTFRRIVYNKTEGYDKVVKYAEDVDLIFKIEEFTKLCFLDEPLYYYRILPKSQSHGFRNTQINRSSTALAKLNAYKRRQGAKIPNLDKDEVAEVLFFGVITSVLAARFLLSLKFVWNLFIINPFFLLRKNFYHNISKKVKKLLKLKKEKPLLNI